MDSWDIRNCFIIGCNTKFTKVNQSFFYSKDIKYKFDIFISKIEVFIEVFNVITTHKRVEGKLIFTHNF